MRGAAPRHSADGGRAGGWAGGGVRPGAGRAERREGRCRCRRRLFPVAGYIARRVDPAQRRPGAFRLASCAAELGARVTAAGSGGLGHTRPRGQLQAVGQRSPTLSESPLPGSPPPRTPLCHPRNLRQVDNSCRGRPARAVSAAYPSPGLRGVPSGGGGGGLAMRAARVA